MNLKKITTSNKQKLIFNKQGLNENLEGDWDSKFVLNNLSAKNIIAHLATLMFEVDLTLNIEKLEEPFLRRLNYSNEFSNITRKYFMFLIDTLDSYDKKVFINILSYKKWDKRIIINESIRDFISESLLDQLSLFRNLEYGEFCMKRLAFDTFFEIHKNQLCRFYNRLNDANFSENIEDIIKAKTDNSKELSFFLRELFHYKKNPQTYPKIRIMIFSLGLKENFSFYNINFKRIKSITKEIVNQFGKKKSNDNKLGM